MKSILLSVQRLFCRTGAPPDATLRRQYVIFATAPCIIAIFVGAWICDRLNSERRANDAMNSARSLAAQTSLAVESLLRTNDLTAVRLLVAEAARVDGVSSCTLSLADGRIVANSNARQVDVIALPDSWRGPIDVPSADQAQSPFVLKSIDLSGRGSLFLRLTLDQPAHQTGLAIFTGFALLAAASLLFVLMGYRRFQRRIAGLAQVSDSVRTLSAHETQSLENMKLSETDSPEAQAWNRLLDRFKKLEDSVKADSIRSLICKGDAASSSNANESTSANQGDLQAVVDFLPTGVLLLDEAGRVQNANGAGASLVGSDRKDLIGVDACSLIKDAGFKEAVSSTLARRHGGERRTIEVDLRATGGGVLRISIRPLRRNDSGGALLTIEDVTQQRIADNSRNQFVAQATHELRAPLTNMRLCLEAALDDDAGNVDALTKHLNVLNDETRRLERLVSEMLSVAEIEAGSLRLKEDDVRLDRLFDEMKSNNLTTCREKQLELIFELPPKYPQLRGDRDKLAATLHNLLNNAIKYTPAGGRITISARQEETRFIIEVSDTGIGISAEHQGKIFQRFYRANDPRVEKITGTGLGLALARDVARLHGGDLTFKSELNRGTTFTLQLPVAMQPA